MHGLEPMEKRLPFKHKMIKTISTNRQKMAVSDSRVSTDTSVSLGDEDVILRGLDIMQPGMQLVLDWVMQLAM